MSDLNLNSNTAILYAKELTTTAIENGLICIAENPTKTAADVYDFYVTLVNKLAGIAD